MAAVRCRKLKKLVPKNTPCQWQGKAKVGSKKKV
jgi:hypothetical protein